VAEPKIVDFKPPWMRDLSEDDRRILEDTPLTGSLPEIAPRINTRILPASSSPRLSAKTLSETIDLTQAVVHYAGYDVYHGLNPDFADLRSLSADVLRLTRLTIEPFEQGSFVIPARLEAEPISAGDREQPRHVTAEEVVNRFNQILASFAKPDAAAHVSIGALQAIESLGQVIRREARAIEFASFDGFGKPAQSTVVDVDYVARVGKVRVSRRPTQAKLQTLEGTLTALDLVRATMQLNLDGQQGRVHGTYPMLFQPTLVPCLGKRVRIQGQVERRGRRIASVQVLAIELLEEAS
jgi:hypothetical protein